MPVKLHNIDSAPWVCLMQLNSTVMALRIKDSLEYRHHGMLKVAWNIFTMECLDFLPNYMK